MLTRTTALVLALSVGFVALVEAQRRHPVSGRVFAPVMGVGGAGWLERPEREAEEAPSKALAALELKAGMVVADIGAGSGYYTSRMSKLVGATGRVYATDIQPGMIELLNRRIQARGPGQRHAGARRDGRSEAARRRRSTWRSWSTSTTSSRTRRSSCRSCGRCSSRAAGWCWSSSARRTRRCPILEVHKMSVAEVKHGTGGRGLRARQGDRRPALAAHHRAAREVSEISE